MERLETTDRDSDERRQSHALNGGIHDYVRNPLKRAVAESIFVSQQGRCQLCKREILLEIDHVDGNPGNWSFANLRLLCHDCNIAERNRQRSVNVRERESKDQSNVKFDLTVITDSPHNPTAKQRALWDEWSRGRATVPSQDQFAFPLLRGLQSSPPMRIFENGRSIARLAVHACGLGSNKTYWEYLMEDADAGMYEKNMVKGEYLVAYSNEFAEIVLYHLKERAKLP